jgi:hypothetical protein
MPRTPSLRPPGRPSKLPDPSKAVLAPPRLRPATTRDYGKGGTPLAGAPNFGVRGAGVGFMQPEEE